MQWKDKLMIEETIDKVYQEKVWNGSPRRASKTGERKKWSKH